MENRAPQVAIEAEGEPMPPVINIMDALKKSMQKQGQTKVRDAVRKRMGKAAAPKARASRSPERHRSGENYIKFDLALGASDSFPLG